MASALAVSRLWEWIWSSYSTFAEFASEGIRPVCCATLVVAMDEVCEFCGGTGMVRTVDAAGVRAVRDCACQYMARTAHRVAAAGIPRRYKDCTLGNFDTRFPGADGSLITALMVAQSFVRDYPVETDGKGLLLTGSIGIGKTHLAVGILRSLIEERGVKALFCDYRELLKEIQNSYSPQVNSTELEVLRPVFEAEVLVLDELGAQKPTDWVWDTVALILNTRYNDKRTTIITTNYLDLPQAASGGTNAQRAMREETLGDRIGERMRSRLVEMCAAINMTGGDYRQNIKRASFTLVQ